MPALRQKDTYPRKKKTDTPEKSDDGREDLVARFGGEVDRRMRGLAEALLDKDTAHPGERFELDGALRFVATQNGNNQAFFSVWTLDKPGGDPDAAIGEFRLKREPDGRFNLHDRVVHDRKKGYGSLLLYAAERFVQHAADATEDTSLYADIGQGYMFDWFEKRGYAPRDAKVLTWVRTELEKGEVVEGDEGYLYAKGTPREKQNGPFTPEEFRRRIVFEKRFRKSKA